MSSPLSGQVCACVCMRAGTKDKYLSVQTLFGGGAEHPLAPLGVGVAGGGLGVVGAGGGATNAAMAAAAAQKQLQLQQQLQQQLRDPKQGDNTSGVYGMYH